MQVHVFDALIFALTQLSEIHGAGKIKVCLVRLFKLLTYSMPNFHLTSENVSKTSGLLTFSTSLEMEH